MRIAVLLVGAFLAGSASVLVGLVLTGELRTPASEPPSTPRPELTACAPDTVWAAAPVPEGAAPDTAGLSDRMRQAEAAEARAEAAREEAHRAAQRAVEAQALAQRQAARDALVETALRVAADVQAWTLRPRAFGGGDGDFSGLSLAMLGYPTADSGRFETVDGVYTLTVRGARATVHGRHRTLDLETRVEVRNEGGGRLALFVDGASYGGAIAR